jgi:hypothetical protein
MSSKSKSVDKGLARMIGLGMGPEAIVGVGQNQTTAAQALINCGFTQVPVIEYVTWTIDLPVPQSAIPGTFGDEIDILQNPKAVPGVTDVDSSFIINGLLQVDMLAIGFGIHGFAEPQQGSQIGNYVTPAPAPDAVPVSPDAFTHNDVLNGALGPSLAGATPAATMTPAILEWGVDAQNALWHLMNAYQFQWIMQQRYQLIKELCADVAYFGSYAEAVAAGSSQEAFQRFVDRANIKYQDPGIGDPGAFLSINAQRVGSVTTLGPGGANVGVFHPTRAYDLIDVTWGGLRAQGMTGMAHPFRKLPKPVLLEKGIPIGMILIVQDAYHQALMQQFLSNNDNGHGTTHTLMPIGPTTSGTTVTPVAGTTFDELTLDATPVIASQQVQTDRVLYKGGALQLAILIKGFEVWGPWLQYIKSNLIPAGLAALPQTYNATSFAG